MLLMFSVPLSEEVGKEQRTGKKQTNIGIKTDEVKLVRQSVVNSETVFLT